MSQKDDLLMQEQYDNWLAHPVTVLLNQYLRRQRELLKEQWANAGFTADTSEKTALLTANAVGQCEVLQTILELQPDQLLESQTND